MSKRILVAVDGSDPADAALDFATEEYPDAEITVLSVIDPTEVSYGSVEAAPGTFERLQEAATDRTERILETARGRAAEYGVDVETESVVGAPARTIVDRADEHGVDGIVVGSHGRRGVSRILLGSVAETVVRRSPVPVTVVR
jgi:nucleotide-binding universal stress UspA family protein